MMMMMMMMMMMNSSQVEDLRAVAAAAFLQRVRIARNASAVIATAFLSVHPSVCPAGSGVLFTRMKLRSCGLQRQVAQSF